MITVHFSKQSEPVVPSMAPNGNVLMEKLMGQNVDEIVIDWWGMFSTALPVEDDVVFLVDAYHELDGFMRGEQERHDVFLGDGLVQFTARQVGGRVVVCLVHTPHLDRRLSRRYELPLSSEEYQAAWNGALEELCRVGI